MTVNTQQKIGHYFFAEVCSGNVNIGKARQFYKVVITAQNTRQQLKNFFYGASDLTEDLPEGKKKMYNLQISSDFSLICSEFNQVRQ